MEEPPRYLSKIQKADVVRKGGDGEENAIEENFDFQALKTSPAENNRDN